jgi:anti-repressor protein
MENLEVFRCQDSQVRVVKDDEGEPWWVAKDLTDILGYANGSRDVQRHCKYAKTLNSTEAVELTDSPRGVLVVPESDLYRLIMRSDKPDAERFQDWVVEEVLPSIRRHGAYMTPQTIEEALTSPDFIIQLATKLKEEQQARKNLEAEKAVMTPKVRGYETLMSGENTISIGDLAKAITHSPAIGRTNMFQFLRDMSVLMSSNLPYQIHRDADRFEVIAVPKTGFNGGETRIFEQTRVTGKGIDFVRRMVDQHYDSWLKSRKAA